MAMALALHRISSSADKPLQFLFNGGHLYSMVRFYSYNLRFCCLLSLGRLKYILGAFKPSCNISITLNDAKTRKQVPLKKENGQMAMVPLFQSQESIAGKICVDPVQGKKVERNGIKIELLGQIEATFITLPLLFVKWMFLGNLANLSSTSDDSTQKLKETSLQKLNFLESQMSPFS
ncbi:hypothetical protein L2E82_22653 [Cichorium intybus]|uniref:Uncharacterized protein n=1 Tax=Cichorium intybus TaxID=13427 RepID=A0ACB9DY48_CICIN|nr:hypothetical protein L2E82_22653 [Cichorium intybus]